MINMALMIVSTEGCIQRFYNLCFMCHLAKHVIQKSDAITGWLLKHNSGKVSRICACDLGMECCGSSSCLVLPCSQTWTQLGQDTHMHSVILLHFWRYQEDSRALTRNTRISDSSRKDLLIENENLQNTQCAAF